MRIHIYPIVSSLHDHSTIDRQTEMLLQELAQSGGFDVKIADLDSLYEADLALILVQSGGSEGVFLRLMDRFLPPFYLLTYGFNNSLAASMEILSFLKDRGEKAEILHGSSAYIAARIKELASRTSMDPVKLGIIGKPSDWLIASAVDKKKCKAILNIDLIDIEMSELIDGFNKASAADFHTSSNLEYDLRELKASQKVSLSLDKLIEKYDLKGLTIRCFDLLDTIHTTGCLGLSLLNKKGIPAACEGDVPALLSMYLLFQITGQPGFQANPSRIDVEKNELVFAHCTLPINMADSYRLTTHFESGIGVAIKGEMKLTDITIFKLSRDLDRYYVEEGKIIENLNEANLCRTQIRIGLPDVRCFLTSPFGNHHIIVYGSWKQKLKDYLDKLI